MRAWSEVAAERVRVAGEGGGSVFNERIVALPVIDAGGKLAGIISYLDVLQALR